MVNRHKNKIKHTWAAAVAFLLLAGGVAFAAEQSQSISLPPVGYSMLVDAVLLPGACGDSFGALGWVDDEDLRVGFGEDGFCRINGGSGAAYNPSHLHHIIFDIRLVAGSWIVSVFVYDTDDNNALILSETGIDMGSDRPTWAEATGFVVASLSAN